MNKILIYIIIIMLVGIPMISCETNQNGESESHPDYELNIFGNVICEKYGLITDPTAILEDKIEISHENSDCYEISIDGTQYKIFPSEFESIVRFPELQLENKYRILNVDGGIILQLECYIGYRESCGYFEIFYTLDGEELIPDSVTFVKAEQSDIVSEHKNSETIVDGDFTYRYYLDGLMLVKYTGNDTEISIPKSYNGLPVICIGNECFSGQVIRNDNECISIQKITSVSMPSIQVIGSSAFFGCTELTYVYAPQVRMIGDCAFQSCNALSTVNFPNALSIGMRAFDTCLSLVQADFPSLKYIGRESFFCTAASEYRFPCAEIIDSEAFSNCFDLRDVYFPKLKSPGSDLFFSCEHITIHTKKGNSTVDMYYKLFRGKEKIENVVYDQ